MKRNGVLWSSTTKRRDRRLTDLQMECSHPKEKVDYPQQKWTCECEANRTLEAPPTLEEPICNGDADAEDGDEGEDDRITTRHPSPVTRRILGID